MIEENLQKELSEAKGEAERWHGQCEEMQKQKEQLTKEAEEFYSADKFNYMWICYLWN